MFNKSAVPAALTKLPEKVFVAVNEAFEELFGYSRKELLGRTSTELGMVRPEEQNRTFEELMERGSTPETERIVYTKGGEARTVLFNVVPVKIEDQAYVITKIHDISERKNLERKLKDALNLLENVYASLDEAIFVVEPRERRILSCNAAAERIFGYKIEEMIGRNTSFLHVSKKTYGEFGKKLILSLNMGHVFRMEFKMRKKDGTVFPTEHTAKELRNESGEPIMGVSVVRDLTEWKRAEEEIKASEKSLKDQSQSIEEMNVALKVMLEKRDMEKKNIEEGFSQSVKGQVIPYLNRIRKTGLNSLQAEYIDILEMNLREITRPFAYRIAEKLLHLSPAEILVANYIKQGYNTKKIASELKISQRTVEFHRNSIRKKLGIKNRNINLKTYLSSLT